MYRNHTGDRKNNLYPPRYPPRYPPSTYLSRFYSPSAEEISKGFDHYYLTTDKENVLREHEEEINAALRKEILIKGQISKFDQKQLVSDYIKEILNRNWDLLEECKKNEWVASATALKLAETLKCPVSLSLMIDPVIVSSGRSFERQYMRQYILDCASGKTYPLCPLTRQILNTSILISNDTLKIFIGEFVETYQNKTGDEWSKLVQMCTEYNLVKNKLEQEKADLKKRKTKDIEPAHRSSSPSARVLSSARALRDPDDRSVLSSPRARIEPAPRSSSPSARPRIEPASSSSAYPTRSRSPPPRQRSVPMAVEQPLLGNMDNTEMNDTEIREYVGNHVRNIYTSLTTTQEQEDEINVIIDIINARLWGWTRTRRNIFPILEEREYTDGNADSSRYIFSEIY